MVRRERGDVRCANTNDLASLSARRSKQQRIAHGVSLGVTHERVDVESGCVERCAWRREQSHTAKIRGHTSDGEHM